jgi:hypothetical protein
MDSIKRISPSRAEIIAPNVTLRGGDSSLVLIVQCVTCVHSPCYARSSLVARFDDSENWFFAAEKQSEFTEWRQRLNAAIFSQHSSTRELAARSAKRSLDRDSLDGRPSLLVERSLLLSDDL